MDVRLATTLGVENVSAFCEEHGISRSVFYKWRTRYRREGLEGLKERSRAPLNPSRRIPGDVEERIVRLRKQLTEDGLDAGPLTIEAYLLKEGWPTVPSPASIWRLLSDAGFITPQPGKRPKSSYKSFVFDRPNECWQIDDTEYQLADGTTVWIVQILDDHSRVCVGSRAVSSVTTTTAWKVFLDGACVWGLPGMVLSDNGLAYNGSRRNIEVVFEANLRTLGIVPITSTPRHPQTCGKVERFHHTTKKWLQAQEPPATFTQLNNQLEAFVDHYNHKRPHSSLGRNTPAAIHQTAPKAGPASQPITKPRRITQGKVASDGCVWSRPWRIAVGRQHTGTNVTTVIDSDHAYIFTDHTLLRHLKLDPTRSYQSLPRSQ